MFGAIAGGIASALAGGAMSKLFGGGQKAASGGIQGDVLATDNNTVGMGDAGIKSASQGSYVPNPDEAVPSFVSGAMAKSGKGLLEDTLHEIERKTAAKYNVMSIPTLMVFKNGEMASRQVGAAPKAKLEQWITAAV